MKSLLLSLIWASAHPYDNPYCETRGMVSMSIDDWQELRVNHGYYRGTMFWGGHSDTKEVVFIDPRVGSRLMAQTRQGDPYMNDNQLLARLWITPFGYIYTFEDARDFWLDDQRVGGLLNNKCK